MSLASFMMRRGCKRSDAKRDAGLTTPAGIIRYDNISYGPHKMNVLDVYRPKDKEGQILPVIVSVHGGGWVYGDKDLYQHYCMDLSLRGFVVVNFTYRLSPEYKFPSHLEDTVKAFDWVLKNADRYGMDKDHIFAVGDSARGHILSLFCILCTNPEYAAKFDFRTPQGFVPKAVALNCGVYDLELAIQGASNTKSLMKDILPNRGTKEEFHFVSPINHVAEKFPPCFIMTANEDFLRTQPEPLMKKLDQLSVPYKYKMYGDEKNVLGHVFHLDMRNDIGKQCNDEHCEWFRGFM